MKSGNEKCAHTEYEKKTEEKKNDKVCRQIFHRPMLAMRLILKKKKTAELEKVNSWQSTDRRAFVLF